MPLQKLGLNVTNIGNLTLPDFDIKNNTAEFLNDIPTKANEVSHGYMGLVILSAIFTFLFWKISQENFYGGDFSFSNMRSISISACICSIIGLLCLNMGYFSNYYHVVIFIVIAFLGTAAVWKAEK